MPLQYPQSSPYNPYQEVKKPKNWPMIILIALGVIIVISAGVYFYINNDFSGSDDNKDNNNTDNFTGEGNDIAFICDEDFYNCADFRAQDSAQTVYDYCKQQGAGDIHRLDADGNGKACESLSQ